jgi:hypothetical protein
MNVMTDASRSTPKRVLRRASELGVHADCVASDYEGACDSCIDIFNKVFHEFYGHATDASEALKWIIEDILRDQNG